MSESQAGEQHSPDKPVTATERKSTFEEAPAEAGAGTGHDVLAAGGAADPPDVPARLARMDVASREEAVMRLQAQRGNQAVARLVARRQAVQRQAAAPPASAAPGGTPAANKPSGLIVDDSASDLDPGQMKRGDFLGQVRAAVNSAVEGALPNPVFLPIVRPLVEQEFAKYSGQGSQALESMIRAQVPGAGGATAASQFIGLIAAQARQEVARQIPNEPGGASALDAGVSAVGGAVSAVGNLLFKADEGGAREDAEPQAVQAQLGAGQSLDSGVRSRMESAFGEDFSQVRVHTDAAATQASDDLNARAFTLGDDVAFGRDEYRPGSLVGDALLAHELAHVVQQRGAGPASGVMSKGIERNALEADADAAAVGAVASLWGGMRSGLSGIAQNMLPRLTSGLGLQRCGKVASATAKAANPKADYVIPANNSPISAPGEEIIFGAVYTHPVAKEFREVWTGSGVHFGNPDGPATRTYQGLTVRNMSVFIDKNWDGKSPATVNLDIMRADDEKVGGSSWTFKKKEQPPTTLTQRDGKGERSFPASYWYEVGPKLGKDPNGDYVGQTILEKFTGRSTNITPDDIKDEFKKENPGLDNQDAIIDAFFGGRGAHGTFVVQARDEFDDRHEGGMAPLPMLKEALKSLKEVTYDQTQIYEAEPGKPLGQFTIRRIMRPDGTQAIKKF